MSDELLSELAKAKAMFQQRAVMVVIDIPTGYPTTCDKVYREGDKVALTDITGIL